VLRSGSLGWLFSVVPSDAAGIATMAVLDAKTNQVYQAKTADELQTVLTGSTPIESTPTTPIQPVIVPSELRTSIDALQRDLDALKQLIP
jgi:hypothetical protein